MEMHKIFSQTSFPYIWLLMQRAIGGYSCKHRIVLDKYAGQKRILEIGCSVGNVSDAFRNVPGVYFCGLDIDANAIAVARKRFEKCENFNFVCQSLSDFKHGKGKSFDYILVAGMLHHIDDASARDILLNAATLLAEDGVIIIYEPERLSVEDPAVMRAFMKYCEQGKFLRTRKELEELVLSCGINQLESESRIIFPDIAPFVRVARFSIISGKSGQTNRG